MRPQYFVFEWLLMTAYLYYIKWYNVILVSSYFGSTGASNVAVACCHGAWGSSSSSSPWPDALNQIQEYAAIIMFTCF